MNLYILGIEGTAHSAGVGIVDEDCNILANICDMYRPEKGGIHPREAAVHHSKVFPGIIKKALQTAGLKERDIGLVAFSQGPGLGPSLRTAATAARLLSLKWNVPLVGVNHCIAHLEVGRKVCHVKDPVLLYVSGGNTQVITYTGKRYRVMGEVLDIGIGNMLDKFGRECGIPFPAGPKIEQMALKGKKLIDLPYTVKGMDVAFSGILTAAISAVKKGDAIEDVCFSLQEVSFAMLIEIAERAMAHTDKKDLLLGGGVARNRRLFEMASAMAESRGGKAYVPSGELCSDNGAMIAWTGYLMYKAGITTPVEESHIRQNMRTDSVDVIWREEL